MTIAEYISGKLDEAVVGIKTNLAARNINASGRTSASFHVNEVERGRHWQIVGGGQNTAPIATLEVGRGGGKIPMGFADIIQEWASAKGFAVDKKGARAIAWSIKRKGTERHQPTKHVDVYSTIVKTTEADIVSQVAGVAGAEIRTELSKFIHGFNT